MDDLGNRRTSGKGRTLLKIEVAATMMAAA
jgi:hypothetical protein